MSQSTKPVASSTSGGGNRRRRRGERERGIPKFCRCGEAVDIKTSGTARNPGRLFYCCPFGSEGDNFHLFTWTDERVVEEVEDLKSEVSDLKVEVSDLRADFDALEKHIVKRKLFLDLGRGRSGCCGIL